jgi:Vacuolar protein sorting 55
MQMNWSPLSKYNDMAAGLKSTCAPLFRLCHTSEMDAMPSRHPTLLRSRSGFLDDHPFVRSLVKLVAPPRRFVILLRDPLILMTLLLHSLIRHCACSALTFVIAPLPNALFSHCGADDFSTDEGEGSGPIDIGRFITAFIVITGFALPLILAHSEIIKPGASFMSLIGGGYVCSVSAAPRLLTGGGCLLKSTCSLVYGTILAYTAAFRQETSDFE